MQLVQLVKPELFQFPLPDRNQLWGRPMKPHRPATVPGACLLGLLSLLQRYHYEVQ